MPLRCGRLAAGLHLAASRRAQSTLSAVLARLILRLLIRWRQRRIVEQLHDRIGLAGRFTGFRLPPMMMAMPVMKIANTMRPKSVPQR
jgi:hypothetical protein